MTPSRDSGSILTRIRKGLTAAARLGAFLFAFWPTAAFMATSAKELPNGRADPVGLRLSGEPSKTAVRPAGDRAQVGAATESSPAGAGGGWLDQGSESGSTGDSLEQLLRATRDPNWKKRWDAVNELGKLKDPRGMSALVERALYDDNPHPRWRSLWAISAIDRKGVDALPGLMDALENADPNVAHNAAIALAYFGQPEARPRILRTLGDPLEFRRWEAVFSLRRLGNKETVPALLRLLNGGTEPSARVRGEAVLVLSRIGDETIVPTLVETLRADVSHEVRWRAALALKSLADVCVTGPLREALSSETDAKVREQIGVALAAVGQPERHRACPSRPSSASP